MSCCQKRFSQKYSERSPEGTSRSEWNGNYASGHSRACFKLFIPEFPVSSMSHVRLAATTKPWEKQHLAVTSLFSWLLVACRTAGNSDAAVCLGRPSSVEIALNAVKLRLAYVGARKHNTSLGDTHDPCTQTFGHHAHSMPQPRTERRQAPCGYQPFCRSVVACWTAENSDAVACFCQPSSVEVALTTVKPPLLDCDVMDCKCQCQRTCTWNDCNAM